MSFTVGKSSDPAMPSLSSFLEKTCTHILGDMDQGVHCEMLYKITVKILEVAQVPTRMSMHKYIADY